MRTSNFNHNLTAARWLTTLCAVVLTCLTMSSALYNPYDAWFNHLFYILDKTNHTAKVVPHDYDLDEYRNGTLVLPDVLEVPSTITCDGEEYTVTAIDNYAFEYYLSSLKSVTLPPTVTSIGEEAFAGKRYLATIDIPGPVTHVGKNAFKDTPWLENQPDGMLYVGAVAYRYMGTMPAGTIIEIKPGTVAICAGALGNQKNLAGVVIPASLTQFGIGFVDQVFTGSRSMTSISVDPGNPAFDSRDNCNAIIESFSSTLLLGCNSTVVPNTVSTIGRNAFSGLSGLKTLQLPNSVTTIDSEAINSCYSLETIVLGKNVVLIKQHAINAPWLKKLYLSYQQPPNAYDTSFNGVNLSTCTLYVPEGSEQTYWANSIWNRFLHIETWDPDVLNYDVDGNFAVDIDDVNVLINVLLKKAPSTTAADVNGDGNADIDDINIVVNKMLGK